MESFNGISGKFYIENSFGQGKYDYAVYDSRLDFDNRTHLPLYVDAETAFLDFRNTDLKRGYIFNINVSGTISQIETNVEGEMIDESYGAKTFKEYLQSLQNKHGRENITYSFEKIN